MVESMPSLSNLEIEQTFELILFKKAKKLLKINSINDLKNLPSLDLHNDHHRSVLKTVLLKLLNNKILNNEVQYQELGFSDANDFANTFLSNNRLIHLLNLLYLLETDPPKFDINKGKEFVEHCINISDTLITFINTGKISSVPIFFMHFSVAVHYFPDKNNIDNQILSNFQELLNKRTSEKINNLI
jgi:hypothetical protein